jgi:hypothetical protein
MGLVRYVFHQNFDEGVLFSIIPRTPPPGTGLF